jgi:hypothetical protein
MTRLYRSVYDDIRIVPTSFNHPYEFDAFETSLLHLAMDIVAADSLELGLESQQDRAFNQTLAFYGAYRTRRGSWSAHRIHPKNKGVPGGLSDPSRTAAINEIYGILTARKLDPTTPDISRQVGVSISTRDYTQHEKMHLLGLGTHSIPKAPEPSA